jgi:hypothetical protein
MVTRRDAQLSAGVRLLMDEIVEAGRSAAA